MLLLASFALATTPHEDLCAALRRTPPEPGKIAQLANAGDVNAPCPVQVSYRVNHWNEGEVIFGILFPPFGLAKLIFGGETRTRMVDVPPLSLGVGTKSETVVRSLLAAGARVDVGAGSESPLGLALRGAVETKQFGVANVLLDAGADPRAPGVVDADVVYDLALVPGALEALVAKGVSVDAEGGSALAKAIVGGDQERFARLLTVGASPGGTGRSAPVVLAAEHAQLTMLEALLAAGASLEGTGPQALTEACGRGDVAMARFLLDRGVPPSNAGDPPLMAAATAHSVELVRLLLDRGAPVNQEGTWERTALNAAAAAGDVAMVRMLLDAGADPKHLGFFEHPAIEDALQVGSAEVAKVLLDAGAPLRWGGRNPVAVAGKALSPALLDVLVAHGVSIDEADQNGLSALDAAVVRADESTARYLLSKGATAGVSATHPRTILHAAAMRGEEEAVALALKLGAPLEAKDAEGRTALWVAVASGRDDAATELIKRKADVRVVDAEGRGLMHAAVLAGSKSMFRLVRDRGFALDARDAKGRTPLHFAVTQKSAYAVQVLLDLGANVDAADARGETPLFAAMRADESFVMGLLVKARADVNHVNADGQTALHVALETQNWEGVSDLLEAKARRDVRDGKGRIPLDVAVESAPEEVVMSLLGPGPHDDIGPYRLSPERWEVGARLFFAGVRVEAPDLVRAAWAAGDKDQAMHLIEAGAPVNEALFYEALREGSFELADAVLARLPTWTEAEWKERRKKARKDKEPWWVRRYLRQHQPR